MNKFKYDLINSCNIYRYVDKVDGITKYVGIVYKSSLEDRIKQHMKDDWFSYSKYNIYYLPIDAYSRTEVEYLESHYINYYESFKYFNKSKAGWGISKILMEYLKGYKWLLYENEEENQNISHNDNKYIEKYEFEYEKINKEKVNAELLNVVRVELDFNIIGRYDDNNNGYYTVIDDKYIKFNISNERINLNDDYIKLDTVDEWYCVYTQEREPIELIIKILDKLVEDYKSNNLEHLNINLDDGTLYEDYYKRALFINKCFDKFGMLTDTIKPLNNSKHKHSMALYK